MILLCHLTVTGTLDIQEISLGILNNHIVIWGPPAAVASNLCLIPKILAMKITSASNALRTLTLTLTVVAPPLQFQLMLANIGVATMKFLHLHQLQNAQGIDRSRGWESQLDFIVCAPPGAHDGVMKVRGGIALSAGIDLVPKIFVAITLHVHVVQLSRMNCAAPTPEKQIVEIIDLDVAVDVYLE